MYHVFSAVGPEGYLSPMMRRGPSTLDTTRHTNLQPVMSSSNDAGPSQLSPKQKAKSPDRGIPLSDIDLDEDRAEQVCPFPLLLMQG